MTCGIPVLLTPVCLDNKCYIDGGIVCNYALKYCVESGKKEDEILGFKNQYDKNSSFINIDSTMLDFIMTFLFKTLNSLNMDHIQPIIKNEVVFNASFLSIDVLKNALRNIDVRKDLFNTGKETAVKFYENINKAT
jgi:predicted acylesterase/phospholipase RssA